MNETRTPYASSPGPVISAEILPLPFGVFCGEPKPAAASPKPEPEPKPAAASPKPEPEPKPLTP